MILLGKLKITDAIYLANDGTYHHSIMKGYNCVGSYDSDNKILRILTEHSKYLFGILQVISQKYGQSHVNQAYRSLIWL